MRKKVFGRSLSRASSTRSALFRSLSLALINTGKIETTLGKAKAVVPDMEKAVTLAKQDTLSSFRSLVAMLGNDVVSARKVVQRIAPSFSSVANFVKMTPLPNRKGDSARMARLEWSAKIKEVEVAKEGGSKVEKKAKVKVEAKSKSAGKTTKKTVVKKTEKVEKKK